MNWQSAWDFLLKAVITIGSLQWIDVLFLLLLLYGWIRGFRNGLSTLMGNVLQVLLTVTVTIEYYEAVAASFGVHQPIMSIALKFLTFLVFTVAFYFTFGFALKAVAGILRIQFQGILDKVLGGLLGAFHAVLILSFVSYFLILIPGKAIKELYEERALTGPFLADTCPQIHHLGRQAIPELWRAPH